MSRQSIPMTDGTTLVIGWDEPQQTWFAFHYDKGEHQAPRAAVGQSPDEAYILRADRPDVIIGDFPITEFTPHLVDQIQVVLGIEGMAEQPPCVFCGLVTFESNPECRYHPYDRLRYNL